MDRRRFLVLAGGAAAPAWWPRLLAAQPEDDRRRALSLSAEQRRAIWRALGSKAARTRVPSGLHVGDQVPGTMNLLRFERGLRRDIPAVRGYRYALLKDRVLLVDPATRKIIAVIGE
jgi:hypothetical protein